MAVNKLHGYSNMQQETEGVRAGKKRQKDRHITTNKFKKAKNNFFVSNVS